MIKIGLVLSGGGARGLGHLGLLCALEELGIRLSVISGVSSGAIVGALYSAGYSPKEILIMVKKHASFPRAVFGGGFFSAFGLKHFLNNYFPSDSFSALHIPLLITTTDIRSRRFIMFSEGSLCKILLGSSAVPGLFAPVKYKDYCLADGGILNNFPVECIVNKCDKIIGCHVNNPGNGYYQKQFHRLTIVEQCFHMAIAKITAQKSSLCDVFIKPSLGAYNMFDIKYADTIFEAGYRATMEQKRIYPLCLTIFNF